ncbi:MAG: hypothetical protein ACI837_002896 [Crocinitomicaceae bacterium]|jgi:hypothetical protein
MRKSKTEILMHICYTELVYSRINKKLNASHSKDKIEKMLFNIIENTNVRFFEKKGKNLYVSNEEKNIRITINSNNYRVITVDLLTKLKN